MAEGEGEIHSNDGSEVHRIEEVTFGFPIVDHDTNVQMKNTNLSVLPHFHGLVSEDLDSFLFKFSYDYTFDAQKLNLFPATLKDATLHWLMGLVGIPLEHGKKCATLFLRNIKTTIRLGN
jgi:hypothetical protein